MSDKGQFVTRYRRMQLALALFTVVMLITVSFRPRWLWIEWGIFLPVWIMLLSRWKCWNCRERLLAHGGADVEFGSGGKLLRHKTCGADLS